MTSIIDFIIGAETGTYVPDDGGEPSKYGVRRDTYSEFTGEDKTPSDIYNLTEGEARDFYTGWSEKQGMPNISSGAVRAVAFDGVVNQGPGGMGKVIQETLTSKFGQDIEVDGIIGPKTISAINNASRVHGDGKVTDALLEARWGRYQTTKNFEKYGSGWEARLDELRDSLALIGAQENTPDVSPYDFIKEKEAGVFSKTVQAAMDSNPQDEEDARRIAKSTGIPKSAVKSDLNRARNFDRVERMGGKDMAVSAPLTTEWFSNPENAAIGQDDVDTLVNIERAIATSYGVGHIDRVKKSIMGHLAKIKKYGSYLSYKTSQGDTENLGLLSSDERVAVSNIKALQKTQERDPIAFRGSKAEQSLEKLQARYGKRFSDLFAQSNQLQADADAIRYSYNAEKFAEADEGFLRYLADDPVTVVTEIVEGNAVSVIGSLAAGGVPGGLLRAGGASVAGSRATATMGASLFGASVESANEFVESLNRNGVDVTDPDSIMAAFEDKNLINQAFRDAHTKGLVVLGVETLAMGMASKMVIPERMVSSPAKRELANVSVQTVADTVAEASGEIASTAAVTGEVDWRGGVVEGVAGFGSQAGSIAVQRGIGLPGAYQAKQNRKVFDQLLSSQKQVNLDQMISLSQESKLKDLSPEKFTEAINHITQNDQDTQVFIDSEVLANSGITSPVIEPRLIQALEAGQEMEMSIAEFLEVAATEDISAIRQSVRIGDGMTQAEMNSTTTSIPKRTRDLFIKAEEAAERESESQRVFDDVADKLRASGAVTEDSIRSMAAVYPARAARVAEDYGISIEQAYADLGLRAVTGPSTPTESATPTIVMEQNFGDIQLDEAYTDPETGETTNVRQSAQQLWDRHQKRGNTLQQLRDCL